MFGGRVFQQIIVIPVGTNCAHLLADFFRYSWETDFIKWLPKKSDQKLAWVLLLCFVCHNSNHVLSSFVTYHRVCIKINTNGATCGSGTLCPFGAHEFTLVVSVVRVTQSLVLVFCILLRTSLFVLFFCSFCCVCDNVRCGILSESLR